MVTDSLQNLEQYRGLHKNMDTVIDFLKKCDLTALPDGKTVIDGERVFVNVMEADLREAEGAEYEYHKRYADRFRDYRLDASRLAGYGITFGTFKENVDELLSDFNWKND